MDTGKRIEVDGVVSSAAWSPDSRHLAAVALVTDENSILGFIGRKKVNAYIYVLNVNGSVESRLRLGPLGDEDPPRIAWGPDPGLFVVYNSKRLYLLEYGDSLLRVRWAKDMAKVFAHRGDRIERVSWNERGEVAVRTEQAVVYGFNASDGRLEWRRRSGLGRIISSIFKASRNLGFEIESILSPGGKYLVLLMGSYIQLSTPSNGKAWGRDLGGPVGCVSWSPREDLFTACTVIDETPWIITMDVQGHEAWRRRIGRGVVKGISWSMNGSRIAVYAEGGERGRLLVFSREGRLLWETASGSRAESLIWDPSGEFLVATGQGGLEVYNGSASPVTESTM